MIWFEFFVLLTELAEWVELCVHPWLDTVNLLVNSYLVFVELKLLDVAFGGDILRRLTHSHHLI